MFDTHKITKAMSAGGQNQAESSLQTGANLQNRYLIQGVLGVGGMGSVYKARDMHFPNVTKLVAVKEILNLASDPGMREIIVKTFEREANILATLNHPAIPKIYDYFTQGDHSFLVQEYIEGKDLEAHLNEANGMLNEDLVTEWAIQLCDVLSYLHNHQPEPIVFRDMKPSNVMLDNHSHIRLIDFGIARGFTAGQKGTMIGTEGYSPPEQYRGEAGPPGDIYALGATLHHLLTKQDPRLEPPFSFSERPVRKTNSNVSVELEAIINTALNYNPPERFPSAQAMKEALVNLRRTKTGILITQKLDTVPAPLPPASETTSLSAGGEVKPIWAFRFEDEVRGSPLVANGVVYAGVYDNNLYAVNALDGKLLWKYATDGGLPGSPAIYQDTLFIGSEDKRLHAVSAKSGRVQWTYYTEGPVRASPRAAEGHVFIGSDDVYLHAVNILTGRRVWRSQAVAAVRCRPAVSNNMIYFGCESGEFYCLDFSGEQKWRFKAKRALTSSPLLFNGTIYVGSVDNMVYALEAASGWAVWKFRTNKPVISSPAVEPKLNLVFVGSADNRVYAIDIRNGQEVWHFETEGQVTSSPAVHKGAVYIGSVDHCVYSIDMANGKLRWKFRSEGPITSSPAIANDIVYIGSNDHHLYALTA
jgi:outer membrane protein assembly factor BamB